MSVKVHVLPPLLLLARVLGMTEVVQEILVYTVKSDKLLKAAEKYINLLCQIPVCGVCSLFMQLAFPFLLSPHERTAVIAGHSRKHEQTGPPLYGGLCPGWVKLAVIPENIFSVLLSCRAEERHGLLTKRNVELIKINFKITYSSFKLLIIIIVADEFTVDQLIG